MVTKENAKDNQIRVRFKGYDHRVVDQSAVQVIEVAVRTGAKVAGPVPLPTRVERMSMVSGPHIDKRGGTQFEIRTHGRLVDIVQPTPQTIESLSHLNLPAGVSIEIKMV